MGATRTTVRRWGSNLAVVIPPATVRAESLKEGDEVILEIRKARAPADVFGLLSSRPLPAQAIKNAIRRESGE
jgi:hypothetical protein